MKIVLSCSSNEIIIYARRGQVSRQDWGVWFVPMQTRTKPSVSHIWIFEALGPLATELTMKEHSMCGTIL